MLYLTNYTSDLEPMWFAYSIMATQEIWVDRWVKSDSRYLYALCIIDIDEHDACVLALNGIQLFKVIIVEVGNTVSPTGIVYDGRAHVANINAALELWTDREK